MTARTTYNGNDLDRTIPYTPAAYTEISDKDYPIPVGWSPETGLMYLPEHRGALMGRISYEMDL